MPTLSVYSQDGSKQGEIEVSEVVFAAPINENILHEVVVAHLANKRQGTQSALTRAEVRGGGIKPFRQKGTGRARQGSSRSPQYEGGGVVFAPKPRDYSKKVNKKVRRAAIRSALSAKVADDNLIVIDEFTIEEPKTKRMVDILNALKAPGSTLIVMNGPEESEAVKALQQEVAQLKRAKKSERGQLTKKQAELKKLRDTASAEQEKPYMNVVRSASNLPGVKTALATELSVYDILNHDKFIVTKDAVDTIELLFGAAKDDVIEIVVAETEPENSEEAAE